MCDYACSCCACHMYAFVCLCMHAMTAMQRLGQCISQNSFVPTFCDLAYLHRTAYLTQPLVYCVRNHLSPSQPKITYVGQTTSPCPPTSSRRASCPPSSSRPSSTDASAISCTCRLSIPTARSPPRPTRTRRRRIARARAAKSRRSPPRWPSRTAPTLPTRRCRPSSPRRRALPPRRTPIPPLPPMTPLPSPPSDIARDSSSATGPGWARGEPLLVSALRTTP
mmetsp:Transcript_32409/g.95509  ORF Transcript_32409/g.95509 Transcript_32409/m.95509 type:complete len:223 (+) Transcript_32409:35-703(+)